MTDLEKISNIFRIKIQRKNPFITRKIYKRTIGKIWYAKREDSVSAAN